jgi:hypothetical protein
VLEQADTNSKHHPVAFYSKTLSNTQSRWSVSERELYAIVCALQHFKLYLMNGVTIHTDHQALVTILTKSNLSPKLSRWTLTLSEFPITQIVYKKGKDNAVADYLSRKKEEELESGVTTERPGQALNPEAVEWIPSPCVGDGIIAIDEPVVEDTTTAIVSGTEPHDERAAMHCAVSTPAVSDPTDNACPVVVEPSQAARHQLAQAQRRDPVWKVIIEYLRTGQTSLPENKWSTTAKLCMRHVDDYWMDEVLYRTRQSLNSTTVRESDQHLICVPSSMTQEIIHGVHGAHLAGHPGETKTIAAIKNVYYWPRMHQDIVLFIKGCLACAARKPAKNLTFPMHIFYTGEPWTRVHMDLVGPFPESTRGNRWLVTFCDFKTAYMEAIPVATGAASEVARAFIDEIVLRYGPVTTLISDNGTVF